MKLNKWLNLVILPTIAIVLANSACNKSRNRSRGNKAATNSIANNKKISSLEAELTKVKENSSQVEQKIVNINKDNTTLQTKITTYVAADEKNKSVILGLRGKIAAADKAARENNNLYNDAEAATTIEELQQKITDFNITSKGKLTAETRDKLAANRASIKRLTQEISESVVQITSKNVKIKRLKMLLATPANAGDKNAVTRTSYNQRVEDIQKLEAEKNELETQIKKLNGSLSSEESVLAKLNESLGDRTLALLALDEQAKQIMLISKMKELTTNVKQLNSAVKERLTLLKSMPSKKHTASDKQATAKSPLSDVQLLITAKNKTISNIIFDIIILKGRSLNGLTFEQIQEIVGLDRVIKNADTDISQASLTISTLETDLEKSVSDFVNNSTQILALKKAIFTKSTQTQFKAEVVSAIINSTGPFKDLGLPKKSFENYTTQASLFNKILPAKAQSSYKDLTLAYQTVLTDLSRQSLALAKAMDMFAYSANNSPSSLRENYSKTHPQWLKVIAAYQKDLNEYRGIVFQTWQSVIKKCLQLKCKKQSRKLLTLNVASRFGKSLAKNPTLQIDKNHTKRVYRLSIAASGRSQSIFTNRIDSKNLQKSDDLEDIKLESKQITTTIESLFTLANGNQGLLSIIDSVRSKQEVRQALDGLINFILLQVNKISLQRKAKKIAIHMVFDSSEPASLFAKLMSENQRYFLKNLLMPLFHHNKFSLTAHTLADEAYGSSDLNAIDPLTDFNQLHFFEYLRDLGSRSLSNSPDPQATHDLLTEVISNDYSNSASVNRPSEELFRYLIFVASPQSLGNIQLTHKIDGSNANLRILPLVILE